MGDNTEILAKAKGVEVTAREYEKTANGDKDRETFKRIHESAKAITLLLEKELLVNKR